MMKSKTFIPIIISLLFLSFGCVNSGDNLLEEALKAPESGNGSNTGGGDTGGGDTGGGDTGGGDTGGGDAGGGDTGGADNSYSFPTTYDYSNGTTPLQKFENGAQYLRQINVSTRDGLISALRNAIPGDHIILASGTYVGGISISPAPRGTRQNPIKLSGPLNQSAVIDASNTSQSLHLIRPSYFVMENITLNGGSQNGLNVDDGGDYDSPTGHVIFNNLRITNVGSGGNEDSFKMSGIYNFAIMNSTFIRNRSGSGIDMVGCHDGTIAYNHMEDMGSNFIQAKGGTSDITILGNFFDTAIHRGVNMGGSTGAAFFRPPISAGTNFEARHIYVVSNVIKNVYAAVAFVGCDECQAVNNLFYRPGNWVFRILQETTSLDGVSFIPSRRGIFRNNIIVFNSSLSRFVNIGAGTDAGSFVFSNNLWFSEDNPSFDYNSSNASLPATERNGIYGRDPAFINAAVNDFHLRNSSPAIGSAYEIPVLDRDREPNASDMGPYGF